MADMMKVKEAAELWGLTPRRVSALCKQGKIADACKEGKAWLIPVGTPRPADQRIRSGAYPVRNHFGCYNDKPLRK